MSAVGELHVERTEIPGLLVVRMPVHADGRGWFKENWQRAKMMALGLPDFGPVQQNVAHNARRGVTRGIHSEPWDKLISVTSGRIFGAWVDLRQGPGFGRLVTLELGPDRAVFVPRGVGNSYQTLEDDTTYSYLVNDHWSPAARDGYTMVSLYDPALSIAWPVGQDEAELSEADKHHPMLSEVRPIGPRRVTITGANGQLGRALASVFPDAQLLHRAALDITDAAAVASFDWSTTDVIINAAAYTKVDEAETPEGRRAAWATNATGVASLAAVARDHRLGLVQVSSDYVFDGTHEVHDEDEPPSPLGVYGQTKAAGELLAATVPRHWIVRTSWVVGEGPNFVDTMVRLARQGACPDVVNDQFGRLTFAGDLAASIRHLITSKGASGVYNLSSDGPVMSWYDIAALVFEAVGRNPRDVSPVPTSVWARQRTLAPRPTHSALSLLKIQASGFGPLGVHEGLAHHLRHK